MRQYTAWVIQWDEERGGKYVAARDEEWTEARSLREATQFARRIDARNAIKASGLINCRPVEKQFG